MATKYHRGRRFEYKVKQYYESHGWFVVRSAGSKGIADLVAIKPRAEEIHLIQCKKHGYLSKTEREELFNVADKYGAVPILAATGNNGRGVVLYYVGLDSYIEYDIT